MAEHMRMARFSVPTKEIGEAQLEALKGCNVEALKRHVNTVLVNMARGPDGDACAGIGGDIILWARDQGFKTVVGIELWPRNARPSAWALADLPARPEWYTAVLVVLASAGRATNSETALDCEPYGDGYKWLKSAQLSLVSTDMMNAAITRALAVAPPATYGYPYGSSAPDKATWTLSQLADGLITTTKSYTARPPNWEPSHVRPPEGDAFQPFGWGIAMSQVGNTPGATWREVGRWTPEKAQEHWGTSVSGYMLWAKWDEWPCILGQLPSKPEPVPDIN